MNYLPQIFFLLCLAIAGFILYKRINRIKNNIQLGRKIDMSDNKAERFKKMMLIAFGQKKMFDKPLVGLMHLVVYVGFIIINIEVLEIILDGLLGTHRLFYPALGGMYTVLINFFEFLAVGVIVVCAVFLIRRNILNIRRFHARELTKWPYSDANIILIAEILLMSLFLTMNATDQVLQARGEALYPVTGNFAFSGFLMPIFDGLPSGALVIIERFAWWFHIIGILAFAIYVTYSKHLHIVMAFPNTYFSRLTPMGKVTNMPVVTREVKSMLGMPVEVPEFADNNIEEPARFGAKDVNDLNWKNLMDAYTCTECGRCTEQCPANKTGKLLSPRKIMMDTRDRMEDIGKSLEKGGPGLEDGKSLYGDYILKEEIMACTTCNACVEACPVNINPLDIIVDIRRFIAMEESKTPASWNSMFANIENNMAPWAFSPADRFNWADKLNKDENK